MVSVKSIAMGIPSKPFIRNKLEHRRNYRYAEGFQRNRVPKTRSGGDPLRKRMSDELGYHVG